VKKVSVAICVPAGMNCKTPFAFSLAGIAHVTPVKLMLVRGESSRSAATARNVAMDKLETLEQIHGRVDYILWLDADMEVPPETLGQLLSHDRDIVGASYLRRGEPFDLLGVPEEGAIQTVGLARFRRLPAGVLLVKRAVFDKVGRWMIYEDADPKKSFGEDVIFCEKAREAGFEIWCDLDLTRRVIHWGDLALQAKGEDSELALFERPSKIIRLGGLNG